MNDKIEKIGACIPCQHHIPVGTLAGVHRKKSRSFDRAHLGNGFDVFTAFTKLKDHKLHGICAGQT